MAYDHRHGREFEAHDRRETAAMDRAAVKLTKARAYAKACPAGPWYVWSGDALIGTVSAEAAGRVESFCRDLGIITVVRVGEP